jgi:hypothetical protein
MTRTVLKIVIVVAACALALESCTLIIDPFYRFDIVSIPTINAQRSVFAYFGRMAKAENICRVRPEQVIIGGSKIEVAMDPHAAAFAPLRTYNLGLAGMPLSEMDQTLRFVVHNAPLKRVVIGLDFLMFNQLRENVVYQTEVVDFDADRINRDCNHAFAHDWNYLVGPKALKYALATMTMQRDPENGGDNSLLDGIAALPQLVDKAGTEIAYWQTDTTAEDAAHFAILFDENGYRANFPVAYRDGKGGLIDGFAALTQEEYYIEKIWRPAPKHAYETGGTFAQLAAMLRFLRVNDVDVRLFTEPLHARMLLAIDDAGLLPQFEAFKRGIAAVAADEGFPLWDFESFNAATEDQSLWWEPSHYRKELGDKMLDSMLGNDNFGFKLTPDNVEDWLVFQRLAAIEYKNHNPKVSADLAAMANASMAKK